MKVALHTFPKDWPGFHGVRRLRRNWHSFSAGKALARAVIQSGAQLVHARYDEPVDCDIAVMWSYKQRAVIEHQKIRGKHVLVMERGFLPPRKDWVSLSWDGLAGHGFFGQAGDNGDRWEKHYAAKLSPWLDTGGNRVLLIGQVPGDAALDGLDIVTWAQEITNAYVKRGFKVTYRPHPEKRTAIPNGATSDMGSLAEAFANADRVVCYNSNTAVEAVLAGIPTVVLGEGSVAQSVCSTSIDAPLVTPDRTAWLSSLTWRQFSFDELRNGLAWRLALLAIGRV